MKLINCPFITLLLCMYLMLGSVRSFEVIFANIYNLPINIRLTISSNKRGEDSSYDMRNV